MEADTSLILGDDEPTNETAAPMGKRYISPNLIGYWYIKVGGDWLLKVEGPHKIFFLGGDYEATNETAAPRGKRYIVLSDWLPSQRLYWSRHVRLPLFSWFPFFWFWFSSFFLKTYCVQKYRKIFISSFLLAWFSLFLFSWLVTHTCLIKGKKLRKVGARKEQRVREPYF